MKEALWQNGATSVESIPFRIVPGWVGAILTVGLEGDRVREDPSEFVVPRSICIRKIIYEFEPPDNINLPCGFLPNNVKERAIADVLMQTCGLSWMFDECRNFGIIGLPGVYKLELNDKTIIGKAQAYLELYKSEELPSQIEKHFF